MNLTLNHTINRLAVREKQLNGMLALGRGNTDSARRLFEEVERLKQQADELLAEEGFPCSPA